MSAARTAEALRHAFDRAFAEPAVAPVAPADPRVALRVAGDPYTLRLDAIAEVTLDRPVTPVPGEVYGFLGVAALRGGLVAVWDLASLLGAPRAPATRWIVVLAAERVGLAVEHFGGVVRDGEAAGSVLDAARVIEDLRRRCRA